MPLSMFPRCVALGLILTACVQAQPASWPVPRGGWPDGSFILVFDPKDVF